MNILLKISIVVFTGIIGGKIAGKLKLPNVTGYIVAGLFLGPSFFKLISSQEGNIISFVNEVALAFIAFSIGGEFLISNLKKIGKSIFIITLMEVLGVVIIVFLLMYLLLGQSFVFSIIIASMSAATAPAGTMMVMRQYRAHGPLTNTILPVAALDDALGIIVFGISLSLAKLSISGGNVSIFNMIKGPFIEVFGSLLLGLIMGIILAVILKKAKNSEELLMMSLGMIIATSGLATYLNLSAILTCMMLGAVLVNLMRNSKKVFEAINHFTPPINLLFFTFAGASLDLSVLVKIGGLGIAYVFARAVGKIFGATIGAIMVKAEDVVKKYLGIALLPQGGISIGLSMIVARELPDFSSEIVTLILFSVLVFEISGPILAKIAITKAGEVNGLDKITSRR